MLRHAGAALGRAAALARPASVGLATAAAAANSSASAGDQATAVLSDPETGLPLTAAPPRELRDENEEVTM